MRHAASTSLRRALLTTVVCSAPWFASAQSNWAQVAVPTYQPPDLLEGLHRHWTAPQADAFATRSAALVRSLGAHCEAPPTAATPTLKAAQSQWNETARAWERLSAVALGPVLERRSLRQIDFTPTRPALIDKAVAARPRSAADLERVGTPAKGLPALERLLWPTLAPGTDRCAYAVQLAGEVDREAGALRSAFRALAERDGEAGWPDEQAVAGVNEFVNQWIGGIERLRWAQMEKPLRAGAADQLPRALSGSTAASWQAQWRALRALARFDDAPSRSAPAAGDGLVPLETWLRGRGQNPLADRLVQAVDRADRAVQAARPQAAPSALAAARELAALKRLVEAEVAPALEVRIGFSDADGD